MQIFPAIDLRGGKCVRLRQGDYRQETVFDDDPVAVATRFARDEAGWLHLVDLDGARAGKPVNHEVVRAIVKATGINCQMGGGIRNEEAIRLMLEEIGVARVIIGTQALKQPDWFAEMVARFPGRLVLGLDARNSLVATEGWLEVSAVPARELAQQYTDLDLAAVVYTNIANDGMMQGIDDATVNDMVALADLGFAVIASGGVTTIDDIRKLVDAGRKQPRLIGAIVGRALYEGTISLREAIRVAADESA